MKATFSTHVDVVNASGAYIVVPPEVAKSLNLLDGTTVLATIEKVSHADAARTQSYRSAKDMTKLVLSTVLNGNQGANDVGPLLFETRGDRKRFVVFEIKAPFDVKKDWDEQLKPLREKYATALNANVRLTYIHVL